MSEIPADKPEVVVESQEISREDAEQMVVAIESAAKGVGDLRNGPTSLIIVKPTSGGEQGYAFRASNDRTGVQTRTEGDDSIHANMFIWRTTPDGLVTDRYTYLQLFTSRSEVGKGFTAQLYLHDGHSSEGEKTSLVGEVSCDRKGCKSSEGELISTKVDDLVVGLLQPELDKLSAEKKARLAEEARVRVEAKLAEVASRAEEARKNSPITKAREF